MDQPVTLAAFFSDCARLVFDHPFTTTMALLATAIAAVLGDRMQGWANRHLDRLGVFSMIGRTLANLLSHPLSLPMIWVAGVLTIVLVRSGHVTPVLSWSTDSAVVVVAVLALVALFAFPLGISHWRRRQAKRIAQPLVAAEAVESTITVARVVAEQPPHFTCDFVPLDREIHSDHLPTERRQRIKIGYGTACFATLRLRNESFGNRRSLITAQITYYDDNWKPLFPAVDGAWLFPDYAGRGGTLGGMHNGNKFSIDGQESAYLAIAFRYRRQMKDGCYGLNTASRNWSGWVNPELLLPDTLTQIKVEVTGGGIKEICHYALRTVNEDELALAVIKAPGSEEPTASEVKTEDVLRGVLTEINHNRAIRLPNMFNLVVSETRPQHVYLDRALQMGLALENQSLNDVLVELKSATNAICPEELSKTTPKTHLPLFGFTDPYTQPALKAGAAIRQFLQNALAGAGGMSESKPAAPARQPLSANVTLDVKYVQMAFSWHEDSPASRVQAYLQFRNGASQPLTVYDVRLGLVEDDDMPSGDNGHDHRGVRVRVWPARRAHKELADMTRGICIPSGELSELYLWEFQLPLPCMPKDIAAKSLRFCLCAMNQEPSHVDIPMPFADMEHGLLRVGDARIL